MRNFDVLVVGELNIDLILNDIDQTPEIGKEILARQMNFVLGSSSAIFASNLSTFGARVAFATKVGNDDFGRFSVKCLQDKNVDTSNIIMDDSEKTGITIVMNYDNDRAMVTYQGAMKIFSINDINPEIFSKVKHLHFSSYFLQPGIARDLGKLFRRSKEAGLTVSFDPQWDPDEKWDINLKEILPYVDVFLPNLAEFSALTGTDDYRKALNEIKDYCNIVAIKAGTKGSYVYYKDHIEHAPAFLNDDVVDAIGAGDSFNAGFVYKFINGYPVKECQTYANLMGAISTTQAGGTAAFKDQKTIAEVARKKFNFIV